MAYRVIKTTNDWNRWGSAVNVQTHVVTEIATLVEAFKFFAGFKNPVEPVSVHFHVEDANGTRLALIDAYRHVVGEEVFQAQLADESFSINLDDWLAAQ